MAENDEIIERLLGAGYDPSMLANTLDLPIEDVLALVPADRRSQAVADAALQNAMRALAWRTVEEAMMILDEGTVPIKLKLIQKLAGDLGRAITVADHDEMEDLRNDFRALTSELRAPK